MSEYVVLSVCPVYKSLASEALQVYVSVKLLYLSLQAYEAYWDSAAVQQGLKRGTLIQVCLPWMLQFRCF